MYPLVSISFSLSTSSAICFLFLSLISTCLKTNDSAVITLVNKLWSSLGCRQGLAIKTRSLFTNTISLDVVLRAKEQGPTKYF